MIKYYRINNIAGWFVFAIAALVYLYTMEPTVSLWDSGEFTAAAFKLEVGHPPGAPFYLMLARIFSLFAVDNAHVAICINSLSAIASAFTVLFLFWIITHLARKTVAKLVSTYEKTDNIKVIGSGIIGSLVFCFSDSFWFSAVEAEVYALSSLFTALVFWSILKWEDDKSIYKNRWLVLISYLMGLSIGVHLLNLLALPAIVLVYFFKKEKISWKRMLLALLVSFFMLFTILYIFIPGTVKLAAFIEIFSVNRFHLPVNSGFLIFVLVLSTLLIYGLIISYRKGNVILNTIFLCITVMLIGYSSYAMILIRAQANTPINTGNPSNAISLLSYLNRDQYGNRPLFYGPYYNAPGKPVSSERSNYIYSDGKYAEIQSVSSIQYDERFMTIFPRMYSSNSNHIEVYKNWGTIRGVPEKIDSRVLIKPTFADNLEFFFKYQLGYMYFRYFLWNFAGKQNDLQGNGGILRGNWISGFDYLDKLLIGSQRFLPDYLKDNKGRNRYFLVPLIFGFLGLVYHYSKSRRYFGVILLLFLLTGIGIAIYTNQTPLQPRERDYAYVGSFFAFSIWIGFGVLWLTELIQKTLKSVNAANIAIIGGMSIPVWMFVQNFDDHNRHGRYVVKEIASNYLNSCDENSILFTLGDNDTYPLWYLQEVEGIRTDVRVANLMLLNANWYIDQMKQKKYLSDPLPMSKGIKNSAYLSESLPSLILKEAIQRISMDINYLPKKMALPVSPEFISKGIDPLADTVYFEIPGSYLGKSEIAVLDILANFNWNRPIYFDTPGYKGTLGIDNYLQLDGFAYKLVPFYYPKDNFGYGKINSDELYQKLMVDLDWENMEKGKGILDDHIIKMLSIMKVRQNYCRLADILVKEGKPGKAEMVLDKLMKIMPPERIPYDHYCIPIAEIYYLCGASHKAENIVYGYKKQLDQELNFYEKLSPWMKSWVKQEKSNTLFYLDKLELVEE